MSEEQFYVEVQSELEQEQSMKVYQAINKVQADLAKVGISKDRKNEAQGYKFRGIDDMYNALAPLLATHGLCILPRALGRECIERVNAKGTALFYVTVDMEFDFISAEDGSKHTIRMFGEAMDSGDKASNKAASAAYKYACMQAFSIPTEGDNDADAQTHEVAPAHITPAQLKEFRDLLASGEIPEGEACKRAGIDGLVKMRAEQYEIAKAWAKKLIAKREKDAVAA